MVDGWGFCMFEHLLWMTSHWFQSEHCEIGRNKKVPIVSLQISKKIIWLRARMGACQSGLCPRTPWTSTECRARWRWDAPSSAISEDDRIKCSSIPSTTPIYRRSCLNELALDNKHMSTDPPEVDVVQQVVACAARDAVLVQLQTRGSLRMRVRILFHYMWQDMAIDIGSPVGTCGAGGGVPGSTVCPCAAHMATWSYLWAPAQKCIDKHMACKYAQLASEPEPA